MKNKDLELQLFTRADVVPNSYNDQEKTIEVVFATETPVKRRYWDGSFNEVLLCGTENVRLERLNVSGSLIDSHNAWSVDKIFGAVQRAWIVGKECRAIIKLSEREEVAGIVGDIARGIIRNISVGYEIHKHEVEEDGDGKIINVRVTDWEPKELSVVPVPADHNSGVRSEDNNDFFKYFKVNLDMSGKTETARSAEGQTTEEVVDVNKVRSDAALQERTRISEIENIVRTANINKDGFAADLISRGVSLDAARSAVLDQVISEQGDGQRSALVVVGENSAIRIDSMTNALLHRIDPSVELVEGAREFKGMSLLDMAKESVTLAGGNVRGLSTMEIAKAALNLDNKGLTRMNSTSDFPLILGNAVNTVIAKEYKLRQRTFTQWAQRGSVKDFKEKSILSIGDFSNLDEVKEGGEYQLGTFGEGKEKMKVVKYGKKFHITWEAIVNDDLDVFSRIPKMIVNAAIRKQSDLVYDVLTGSQTMSDGKTIFHADHKNLATAAALDIAGIGAARKMLRNQKSLDGKDVLDLTGKYLIVGADQEEAALQYTSNKFVPNESNKQNVWAGLFIPIVEPRITGNKWFLLADSSEIDTVEYAFLEGQPEIFTEERVGFDVDGLEIKVRMVFGAKAVDHRGMVKNPGA